VEITPPASSLSALFENRRTPARIPYDLRRALKLPTLLLLFGSSSGRYMKFGALPMISVNLPMDASTADKLLISPVSEHSSGAEKIDDPRPISAR